MIVYDAEGHILGRLCSAVAQKLLAGEEVTIVNAEKAIITGNRDDVLATYKAKKDRGRGKGHGPYFPRRADLIMKRSVRGMIPFKTPTGRNAYKRLKVFVGVPQDLQKSKLEKVESATRFATHKYVTLGDVSAYLGSNVR